MIRVNVFTHQLEPAFREMVGPMMSGSSPKALWSHKCRTCKQAFPASRTKQLARINAEHDDIEYRLETNREMTVANLGLRLRDAMGELTDSATRAKIIAEALSQAMR